VTAQSIQRKRAGFHSRSSAGNMGGEKMETELRRWRSNLGSLGSGVIVFTVWELIRPILISLLVQKTSNPAPAAVTVPELSPALVIIVIIAVLVLAILNILLRFHIGRAARAEAAGKRKGSAYVVFAFLIFGFQTIGFLITVVQLFRLGLMGNSVLRADQYSACAGGQTV